MGFQIGDPVVHTTYGFGQIICLEERALSGTKTLYYEVQMRDLTVWVPADDKLESRLRSPTSVPRFKQLLPILSSPGEPLPENRHERKTHLLEQLKDGRVKSLFQIIRDLSSYSQKNDSDQALLQQAKKVLLGEWGFVLSITHAQAEFEMYRLLDFRLKGIEN